MFFLTRAGANNYLENTWAQRILPEGGLGGDGQAYEKTGAVAVTSGANFGVHIVRKLTSDIEA